MLKINKNTEPKIGMYLFYIYPLTLEISKVYITGVRRVDENIWFTVENDNWWNWKYALFRYFWTELRKVKNVVKNLKAQTERQKLIAQEHHALYCELLQFKKCL